MSPASHLTPPLSGSPLVALHPSPSCCLEAVGRFDETAWVFFDRQSSSKLRKLMRSCEASLRQQQRIHLSLSAPLSPTYPNHGIISQVGKMNQIVWTKDVGTSGHSALGCPWVPLGPQPAKLNPSIKPSLLGGAMMACSLH